MAEDSIDSSESEGAFNEFIDDRIEDMLDNIINDGDLSDFGDRGSDIIIEMDDIQPPKFTYGGPQDGAGGKGNQGPGEDAERIKFQLPFDRFMELAAKKLGLPNLCKEGKGKIKEVSYEFKTFGTAGILLDKKRTFRRALKTSVGLGTYNPAEDEYDIQIRRRDKRFKLPERVEKPKFKAVVFYMGDISYSTYGERLELEKKVVAFIHAWLNYNYGPNNVDHRFFVHDAQAHEVQEDQFFSISNAGGTRAAIVFDLVSQVAFNEYDVDSTNFYGFYFGDGELFNDDALTISTILNEKMCSIFNRIGIVEVKPGNMSNLIETLEEEFSQHSTVSLAKMQEKKDIVPTLKTLFKETQNAKH